MRGKEMRLSSGTLCRRITPAYAGKSVRVHRVRQSFTGSPPPMRGKDAKAADDLNTKRITPAYAGKSANSEPITLDVEDHPRLCGEKIAEPPVYLIVAGSPPPMRGKGHTAMCTLVLHRITPAYAGKRRIA